MKRFCFILLSALFASTAFSQSEGQKNTIYINLTNPIIFGDRSYIIGYERVVGKSQSFTINIGRMSLPRFRGDNSSDSVQLVNNSGDKGFHISADYRFYLKKENKYAAPRGVYIGPYYSYNYFSRSNAWLLNTTEFNGNVNTDLSLSYHTVGMELGYQFILWKKLAIDFVLLGPGLGFYKIQTSLNTTLGPDEEALLFEKLNSYLDSKIPGYNLVIDEGTFKKTGSVKTTAAGFRYMINIGFRF